MDIHARMSCRVTDRLGERQKVLISIGGVRAGSSQPVRAVIEVSGLGAREAESLVNTLTRTHAGMATLTLGPIRNASALGSSVATLAAARLAAAGDDDRTRTRILAEAAGRILRDRRCALRLTQVEVAKRSGIPIGTLPAVERGAIGYDTARIAIIARTLRLDPTTVLAAAAERLEAAAEDGMAPALPPACLDMAG